MRERKDAQLIVVIVVRERNDAQVIAVYDPSYGHFDKVPRFPRPSHLYLSTFIATHSAMLE